ncbi:caspase family protein [Bradyrhizobium sp. SZCCHNR1051]|uniref:caspase family protein n=1 Tax=Bradyrhizobium sp. SZCCHNR1051 TaxID=3057355 RepID=UPI002915DD8F|nr:caspase family protein [Bradyrhizobium sp. SZCCHNR1051]
MKLNADALIIGIDRYDRTDFPELPGCVNDAVAAAKWLLDIGVPPERIIAHVSPMDPHQFPGGLIVLPADAKAIRLSFTKLSEKGAGDKLFLFMSGHGKHVLGEGPLFLCQDFMVGNDPSYNLKIDEYIGWLRSWRYRDQFLFYDACQDATASVRQIGDVKGSGPTAVIGTYRPDPAVAFTACYACSAGERAWAGDGRGVLVRYALEELDPKLWAGLHNDDPEQDAIVYDWSTGTRIVDLNELFKNIISGKIMDVANTGDRFQTPFCQPLGRALVDGYSAVMALPPIATSTVNLDVDPPGAVRDVRSVSLRSQIIVAPFRMPSKGVPLKIPAILKLPLQDQINAACRLAPESVWRVVNIPLVQRLGSADAEVIFELRQPPPTLPRSNDGTDEINIVVDPRPGGGLMSTEIARQLAPDGKIGGAILPPNATFRKDANGLSITFSQNDSVSILNASRLAIDWLKTLRRADPGKGGHIVLSPVGQPRDVQPNVHFDFDKSTAALLGGFLENNECVTIDSYSDEMPKRTMSLRDTENHPVEWLEPGQYRITIDLPWGKWTERFRVGEKAVVVGLPQRIGLEPLRNRYRRHDLDGPALIKTDDFIDLETMPIAVRSKDTLAFWTVPATGVPVVAIATKGGLRVELYSETTLREWDELITVGRFSTRDSAGLLKALGGKIPDGTALDFVLFAIASAYAEFDRRNLPAVRMIMEMIDEQAVRFRDIGLLRLAVDVAEGRLVGSERQHAIMLEIVELFPKAPVFRWGVSLLTDLARRTELPLPRWVDGIDPSSSLTVLHVRQSARLDFPLNPLNFQAFGRPVRVLPAVGEVLAGPLYTDVVMQPDLDGRMEKRLAEWQKLQGMIETDKAAAYDPDILQEQKLLLEHLVEEDDTERETKPEKDESGEAEPA